MRIQQITKIGSRYTMSLIRFTLVVTLGLLLLPCITSAQDYQAGFITTLCRCPDGTVYGFGAADGQLGVMEDINVVYTRRPKRVEGLQDIETIWHTGVFAFAKNTKGQCFVWGYHNNLYTQGKRLPTEITTPTHIPELDDLTYVPQCSYHPTIVQSNSNVMILGQKLINSDPITDPKDQFNKYMDDSTGPARMINVPPAKQVAGTLDHCVILDSLGNLWVSYNNAYGILGIDSGRLSIYPAERLPGLDSVLTVTSSYSGRLVHFYAIRADSTLWMWGNNIWGMLGAGHDTIYKSSRMRKVEGLQRVIYATGGQSFSIALTVDGRVYAWGRNLSGQLCDGTFTNRYSPQVIENLPPIEKVTVGAAHVIATARDGSVWAWGGNTYFQLNDLTPYNRNLPIKMVNPCATSSAPEQQKQPSSIVVRPNPSSSTATLSLPQALTHLVNTNNIDLQVLDVLGRVQETIQTVQGNSIEINVESLPSGIYNVVLMCSNPLLSWSTMMMVQR